MSYLILSIHLMKFNYMYNIYINNLHLENDYIGFIHHDYKLIDSNKDTNITKKINNILNDTKHKHLSFTIL